MKSAIFARAIKLWTPYEQRSSNANWRTCGAVRNVRRLLSSVLRRRALQGSVKAAHTRMQMVDCYFLKVTQQQVHVFAVDTNGKQRVDIFRAERAHVPLDKRENWWRNVTHCRMMRRANFSLLRDGVIIVIEPTIRDRLITNPCSAPASIEELMSIRHVTVLLFLAPFSKVKIMRKAMFQHNELERKRTRSETRNPAFMTAVTETVPVVWKWTTKLIVRQISYGIWRLDAVTQAWRAL